ncbi:hypothetical protein [Syntrophorhabdus aromaticivorans]|jgi:5-methylcytosine-specific restriction protein A|uniref:hypothetical protein n=1 Tax=Syntrophorhabdus aromaticivorans TaxID=328301 RepID=UPI0004915AD2|nr:hypothetical protein [Syntrophorhabdus aromaticivorans]
MKSTEREDIEKLIRFLLHDGIRSDCLRKLCDAICQADSFGSNKWGVSYEPTKVRLLIGSFIAFTIEKGGIWLALDADISGKEQGVLKKAEDEGCWRWDTEGYPEYRKVPSRNGYYDPTKATSGAWDVIKGLHFRFLEKVANKYRALLQTSRHCNKLEVLNYLREEMKCSLPEPKYD